MHELTLSDLKAHTDALNRAAESNNTLAKAITEAPDKSADAAIRAYDHMTGELGTVGLIVVLAVLKVLTAYVQSKLSAAKVEEKK